MNSPSWEMQEDRFDDVDSESDAKSVYEDDFYIDDPANVEEGKLNEPTEKNDFPLRLSTIAEESNIVTEGNETGVRKATYVDSVFGPGLRGELSGENVNVIEEGSLFGGGEGIERLQHDQESFYKHNQLAQDDVRFNNLYQDKENTWEPSIHHSPPPSPKICVNELAVYNMTDSHLIPAALSNTQKEASQDTEKTPQRTSSSLRHSRRNESKQNSGGPKMSTPKSTDNSLRDLSINCISSIYPEIATPKSVRETNLKFSAPLMVPRKMTKIVEEPLLTSSAIDRVLEVENFDSSDALIEALLQAQTHPRVNLKLPGTIAEHPETDDQIERFSKREKPADVVRILNNDFNASGRNKMQKVITRHDRSGITNKVKKLKTVQELNLLREGSNTAGDLPPVLSENLKSRGSCSSLRKTNPESQGRFLSCDQSFVYFGFVDVKCRVNRAIRLRNISSKSLNLRLQLHSTKRGYELLEQGVVVLKPQETYFVHVIFQPPFGACFQNTLTIEILNAEHVNYSIPLLGSGGVAALRILTHPGLSMLRDGSFVLTAQGVTDISFEVENRGVRDAFVRVVVMNKETKKAVNRCIVTPSDCVSILHRSKQEFSIVVPSLYGEESNGNSTHSLPFSSFSLPSSVGNTQYYVQLLWGEEAQRRRLKRYENVKSANFLFNGLTFTKCKFMNEEKCKSTFSENVCYGLYDRDAFELGLRVTLLSVVDNRLSLLSRNTCFPQEDMVTESVILEPNAPLSPAGSNKSVVEDVSNIFAASRAL